MARAEKQKYQHSTGDEKEYNACERFCFRNIGTFCILTAGGLEGVQRGGEGGGVLCLA